MKPYPAAFLPYRKKALPATRNGQRIFRRNAAQKKPYSLSGIGHLQNVSHTSAVSIKKVLLYLQNLPLPKKYSFIYLN